MRMNMTLTQYMHWHVLHKWYTTIFAPDVSQNESNLYLSTFLFFQLDAHRNIKTIKIPTVAPTCFGSRWNHHQGAISCFAKSTVNPGEVAPTHYLYEVAWGIS
jgi:hypothetical protein